MKRVLIIGDMAPAIIALLAPSQIEVVTEAEAVVVTEFMHGSESIVDTLLRCGEERHPMVEPEIKQQPMPDWRSAGKRRMGRPK